ncbi:hypothetical protein ACTFIZ_007629 [Dictyostelium cf. discoideum]
MSTNNNNINNIINNENVNNNNNNNNEDNGNEIQQQSPVVNIQQHIQQQQQVIEEQRQLLEQVTNQFKHLPQPIITPPQSPRQPTPITSSTITKTIKKTLQGSNIDDTDHHLLHGSFSTGCKVGTTSWKYSCHQQSKRGCSSHVYPKVWSSSNMSTETVLDDLIESGKFDEELSRLISCVTDGINGLIQLGVKVEQLVFSNKVRVRLFMKLCNKKIQQELATSANEVYNNTNGWNDFKLAVQQEISIGEQFNFQKLKKLLVVPFNVQGNSKL